jgi:hypothetical protein
MDQAWQSPATTAKAQSFAPLELDLIISMNPICLIPFLSRALFARLLGSAAVL